MYQPEAYISPSLYASKQQHGRVVPTWNYSVVHAHGRLAVHGDAQWIEAQLRSLIEEHEGKRPQPWQLDDAPRPYVEGLMKALVGFEIEVRRFEGKAKLSQNKAAEDRQSILKGLEAEAPLHPLTELMRRRNVGRDSH